MSAEAKRLRVVETARELHAELPSDPHEALLVTAVLFLGACEQCRTDPGEIMRQVARIMRSDRCSG